MKKIYFLLVGMLISIGLSAQDYSQIYIVGSATPTDWNNQTAEALTLVEGSDAVFTWSGQLRIGEFKFLNGRGTWDNCFNPAETTPVVLGESYNILFKDGGDKKFLIATPGLYTVTVDLINMTVVVTEKVVVLPTSLWMSGTAIPGGKMKMTAPPSGDKTKFRYIGELKSGNFGICSTEAAGAGSEFFCPTTNGIDVLGETSSELSGTSTGSWSVTNASQLYKITVDLFNKKMTAEIFEPWENLYMVGGATPVGWDAGLAIPLVRDNVDPSVFVYDGDISIAPSGPDPNKFKILAQLDWGPNSLHPYSADELIIGSTNILMNLGDDKWIVSPEQQGHYRITVNLFRETIFAEYLDGGVSVDKELDNTVQILAVNGRVELQSSDMLSNVQLMDIAGKTVAKSTNGTTVYLGENLSAGIYLLSYTVNNKTFVKKVAVK